MPHLFPLTIGAGGATVNLAQVEELYTLTSECRLLSIGLEHGFCQLSGEEAASRLQALATAQKILCKPQGDASNAWEESHMPLLMHVTKFNAKLGTYLGDANKDMTDKAQEIWTRIQAMAMALDMTPDMHLRLTLFLLDRLLVISLGLSFWQDIPFSLMLSQTPRPPYHWLKWGRLCQGSAGGYQTRTPWMNLGSLLLRLPQTLKWLHCRNTPVW